MTTDARELPDGVELVRTSRDFDQRTVPAGLRSAHRIADGVWGRLVILSGSLEFVVEGASGGSRHIEEGGDQIIPPGLVHHVEVDGPVVFHIEFHR